MTAPDADVASAVDRIAAAWARRSGAEQAAFTDRIGPKAGPRPPSEEVVQRVRERAALSGAVAPADLVIGLDEREAAHALEVLAPEFDRVHDGSTAPPESVAPESNEARRSLVGHTWAWTMRSAARRETLTRLAAEERVTAALADTAAIPTDAAGRFLRGLATDGRPPPPAPDDPPNLAVQALAWAVPLGGLSGHLAEARRRARVQSITGGYRALLRDGFYGRADVLARLRAFADAPAGDGPVAPLMVVTGMSGAGKTTVLAEFLLPYLDRVAEADPEVPAVVVIDFERLQFRIDAELELSFEVTRQVGNAAPVAGADFSALRHQFREVRRFTGGDLWAVHASAESDRRGADGFEREAGQLTRLHGLENRPMLLVLDSFEEWQRVRAVRRTEPSGTDAEARVLAWVARLRDQMGLRGLRVIVSGRAGAVATASLAPVATERIGELAPDEAAALLVGIGVAGPADAAGLAAIVGGNPLALHVAARLFGRLDPAERERFLAGADAAAGLSGATRRAFLYDRFLAHITDPRVRALSHPGLFLRRVTPAIVRHVLAPTVGLDDLGEDEAEVLTRRLADEVWLVNAAPDGLWHRPDVRQEMLRTVAASPAAHAVHAAAVEWYERGRDDLLPHEQGLVEAYYHRLMQLGPDDDIPSWMLDAAGLRRAVAMGESIAELSPRIAAQLRVARGDDVGPAEAALLPAAAWDGWMRQRGAALVQADDAPQALALLGDRTPSFDPDWLPQAYCDAGRWTDYWQSVGRSEAFAVTRVRRYAAVNAIVAGWTPDTPHDWFSGYTDLAELTLENLYFALLLDPSEADNLVAEMSKPDRGGWTRSDRFPVDQFRRVLTWAAAGCPGPPLDVGQLAGLYRPDPAWAARIGELAGGRPVTMPVGLRSDQILSDWAAAFARSVEPLTVDGGSVPAWLEALRGDNPELRPAVRRALAGRSLRSLASIAWDLLPVRPTDLAPDAVPPDDAFEARAGLGRLVEYVDRSGVLGPFLARVPDGPDVDPVRLAFARWDAAHERLFAAIARDR